MDYSLSQLVQYVTSPLGMLLLLLLAIAILVSRSRNAKRSALTQQMQIHATLKNIEYHAPDLQSSNDTLSIPKGTHTFNGNTNGIAWTVEALYLHETDFDDNSRVHRGMSRQYTRWQTKELHLQPNEYILIMNLPEGTDTKQVDFESQTGLFAKLAQQIAEVFLAMFIRMYFGKEQLQVTPVSQEHYVPTAFPQTMMRIFSNVPNNAQRTVTYQVQEILHNHKPEVFSVLVNQNGTIFSTPTYMNNLEHIEALSEYCSSLCNTMR